jgi:hypothetical protein
VEDRERERERRRESERELDMCVSLVVVAVGRRYVVKSASERDEISLVNGLLAWWPMVGMSIEFIG